MIDHSGGGEVTEGRFRRPTTEGMYTECAHDIINTEEMALARRNMLIFDNRRNADKKITDKKITDKKITDKNPKNWGLRRGGMNGKFVILQLTSEMRRKSKDKTSLRLTAATGLMACTVGNLYADTIPVNARDAISLEEVNVVALKQENRLAREAVSSTIIGIKEAEKLGIVALKGMSDVVPNFYIPDYGSRITSSIYVRGLGARIDQPAVGLTVDNVSYMNKDAYDFDIADISSMEMLRGPQSTLFGRNTMGGLINITTLSPMRWQGWRVMAEGGNGFQGRLAAGWYGKPAENQAMSFNLNYNHSDGFFTNEYNGKKLDKENGGGARWKYQWRINQKVYIQNVAAASILRQGGYPYENIESGRIAYNDTCFYRRFTFTDGLTLNYRGPGFRLTSVTAVQHINDNMTLDQDFLPESYFTLTQRQRETSLTQDVVLRGEKGRYKWLGGVFGFYKHLVMNAPVTFKDTGIAQLIEGHRNSGNPSYPISWDSREFPLYSDFTMPTFGVALYHQSEYNLERWHFTAGIRLDFEQALLDYHSYCNTGYQIFHREGDEMIPYTHVPIDINDTGEVKREYFNWMPRISVLYDLRAGGESNLYATVSKGYKAGGFNTQMFSEILQGRLMSIMGMGANHDVNEVVGYQPEYSWNYEIGGHLAFPEVGLRGDWSLFYIDCRDQQLTTFPSGTTTGRMMTNAGQTRSIGGEISIGYRPIARLEINASYGYTNAKFVKYDDGIQNYKGKNIPYAPRNTIFGSLTWLQPMRANSLGIKYIEAECHMKGTGKIYWNESNSLAQNLYAEMGAGVTFQADKWSIRIWGENLTATQFDTFYFKSMGNEFLQRGKPLRVGATVRFEIPKSK